MTRLAGVVARKLVFVYLFMKTRLRLRKIRKQARTLKEDTNIIDEYLRVNDPTSLIEIIEEYV